MAKKKDKSSKKKDKKSKGKSEKKSSADSSSEKAPDKSNEEIFSPDFEAGLLFEKLGGTTGSVNNNMTESNSGGLLGTGMNGGISMNGVQLKPLQFQQMFAQLKNLALQKNIVANNKVGMTQSDSFEAGRLFARYDRNSNGKLSKEDFASMFRDLKTGDTSRFSGDSPDFSLLSSPLNNGIRFPDTKNDGVLGVASLSKLGTIDSSLLSGGSNHITGISMNEAALNSSAASINVKGSSSTTRGLEQPILSGIRLDSAANLGNIGASTSSYEQLYLRSINGKKTAVLQQLQAVQSRMAEVQGMRRAIEQETLDVYQPIIRRLAEMETQKLSILQHGADELKSHLNSLHRIQQHVLSNRSYQDLLRLICEVVHTPITSSPLDVTPDFNREAAVDAQKVKRYDAAMKMLRTKDQMLWLLVKERNSLRKAAGMPQSEFQMSSSYENDAPYDTFHINQMNQANEHSNEHSNEHLNNETVQRYEDNSANEIETLSNDFCVEMEYMTNEVERIDKDLLEKDNLLKKVAKLAKGKEWNALSDLMNEYNSSSRANFSPISHFSSNTNSSAQYATGENDAKDRSSRDFPDTKKKEKDEKNHSINSSSIMSGNTFLTQI